MMQSDTLTLPMIPDRVANVGSVFQNRLFKMLWIAGIASNIGSSMQDVGSAWLMTDLNPSPMLVSLIQTSGTLPIFLFSLFSGVLADLVPRRTLLLVTQAWMSFCALLFAFLTLHHTMNPLTLLALNFALATGAAFNIPPWQSLTSDIVGRRMLKQAVVVQSAGSNIARSVGPAIGGIAVSFIGPGLVFALNAISFAGVMAVLIWWHPKIKKEKLPAERFFTAMRIGIAYARNSREVQNILVRTVLFVFGAIALMGLLPHLVRERLHEGPKVLGLLLTLNGVGAVGMAFWLKKLTLRPDDELTFGTIAYASAIMMIAWTHDVLPYSVAMLLAGAGWLMANSTLNTATQLASPEWVKARSVAIQQLTFYGSIAFGSVWWGFAAMKIGTHQAMSFASIFLLVGLVTAKVAQLNTAFEAKVRTASFLAAPEIDEDYPVPLDHGPVMATVEYVIADDAHSAFEAVMQDVRLVRLKTGVLRWEVFCDVANRNRYIEIFFNETWADHLRLHERTTEADEAIIKRIYAFHVLEGDPKISHYIYDTAQVLKSGAQEHNHDQEGPGDNHP